MRNERSTVTVDGKVYVAGQFYPSNVTGIYFRFKQNGKKTWYFRYTRPDGKRTFEKAESFDDAKDRLRDVTRKIKRGTYVVSVRTTVNDILPAWRREREAGKAKPRTREGEERNIRLYVAPRWGRTRLVDIKPSDIGVWLAGLKGQNGKPLADGTRAVVMAQFSCILTYAVEQGAIERNPVRDIPKQLKPRAPEAKKTRRAFKDGEFEQLLTGLGRQTWLGPILRFAMTTGTRLGEVLGLQWKHIDFENRVILIEQALSKSGRMDTPKNGKPRVVPMLPGSGVEELLRAQYMEVVRLRLRLGLDTDMAHMPVFPNTLGGFRQQRDVQRAVAWARERSGVSGVSMHSTRHSTVTRLMNSPGAVGVQVMAMLGHGSLAITESYISDTRNEEWEKSAGAALANVAGGTS